MLKKEAQVAFNLVANQSNQSSDYTGSPSFCLSALAAGFRPSATKFDVSWLLMGTLTILLHTHFPRRSGKINQSSQHGLKKCPVYLHLPWLGNVSTKFEKQITTVIQHCYFAVETLVVFTTRPLLSATKKNILPAHHHNNVIYQFVCHCDSRYIGRTSQRLQERIKQHVPRSIRNHHSSQDRPILFCACKKNSTSQVNAIDSAIGQHLLENPPCASQ